MCTFDAQSRADTAKDLRDPCQAPAEVTHSVSVAEAEGRKRRPLPILRNFQNLTDDAWQTDFDRSSVAYGLAFGGRDLMCVMCSPETPSEAGLRENNGNAEKGESKCAM
jgi:hypothetical protein